MQTCRGGMPSYGRRAPRSGSSISGPRTAWRSTASASSGRSSTTATGSRWGRRISRLGASETRSVGPRSGPVEGAEGHMILYDSAAVDEVLLILKVAFLILLYVF